MVEPPMASSTTATLTTDADFEALAHRHRRAILRHLADTNGTVPFDQLAEALLADANGVGSHDVAQIQLHHRHLPKLQQAGLIDYNAPDDRVRYVGTELVEDLLGGVGK